jgi:filamentous hemagglutinin family protein
MNSSQGSRKWQVLISALIVGGVATFGNCALGQVVGDTTLGAESSLVTSPTPGSFQIDGGATRETNLFHSFQEFSIPTNGSAFFNNALTIENIISRVTGASGSNINGAIRTNGTANLFLINPNGIVFGAGASLNIRGSFLASTARGLLFDNGFEFSAINPQAPPLLTINVPIGLQTGANPGRIVNQSRANGNGLEVQPGRTLALMGGEVAIEGGILYAPDGRIELGSVAGNERVSLTPTLTGYALGYEGVENFQDIRLSQGANVTISGNGGGSIQVQGRNVAITDGSQVVASLEGAGLGGSAIVNASDSLQVIGTSVDGQESRLGTQSSPTAIGRVGDLKITTGLLLIQEGAQVITSTFGSAKGGSLIVNASDSVQVIGISTDERESSRLSSRSTEGSTGDAGDLTITTGQLLLSGGGRVSASTYGAGNAGSLTVNASDSVQVIGRSADSEIGSIMSVQAVGGSTGDAGDMTITTRQLLVSGGALISSSTFGPGKGGSLIINASEEMQVIGAAADEQVGSFVSVGAVRGATGNAGDLRITTQRLLIREGGQVSAGTFGSGNGGSLTVNASEEVQVIGTSPIFQHPSGLSVQVADRAKGAGGNLRISTGRLSVQNGAQVSAGTFGDGPSGNLEITATESVELIGTSANRFPSRLEATTRTAGDARNLTIKTGQLTVRDGARITVSSTGSGKAGNLIVDADSILLSNQASLQANTTAGEGNITLRSGDLILRRGSNITTNATGSNNIGGNIFIDTDNLVAVPRENSDISANSTDFRGGNIRINAQGIFGTQFRSQPTPLSDITASGKDSSLNGTVEIITPGVDPSRGLTELPSNLVDATESIDRSCTPASRRSDRSSFTITGRGGLPLSPYDPLQGRSVVVDWVTLDPQADNRNSNDTSATTAAAQTPTITEAQDWMYGSNGEVILTAQAPNVTSQSPALTPATCSSW